MDFEAHGVMTSVVAGERIFFFYFFLLFSWRWEMGEGRKGFIHQRMREPDFGAVHRAISGGFEDGEIVCVFGVEEEGVD